jgi:hypothetical protein
VVKGKKSKNENLDYLYPAAMVAKKAVKTEKLLAFLSKQDPSLSLPELRKLAELTFRKLQECWGKREYDPMDPLLLRALFLQHTVQLQALARNHEINRIDDLQVERVDIVNIRYTEKSDQREFSALITASARDYYLDDRNQKFLRGDQSPARFQEFWTFQRAGDGWLLREIEQAGESDLLKEENIVEMLTDQTLQGIYGGEAGKEGKAGPWLEKGTEEKATRIDRLLNFLVRTDRLWDRQAMLNRARQLFLSVYLARESGAGIRRGPVSGCGGGSPPADPEVADGGDGGGIPEPMRAQGRADPGPELHRPVPGRVCRAHQRPCPENHPQGEPAPERAAVRHPFRGVLDPRTAGRGLEAQGSPAARAGGDADLRRESG